MQIDSIEIEQLYINDKDKIIDSEIKLWRAVISNALDDVCLPPSNLRYRKWRNQARKWFIDSKDDFYTVCELAALSPADVLTIAYNKISTKP